jgi:hypothetical protein
VGADFYDAARGGFDYLNDNWTIPTDDLSKIYLLHGMAGEPPEKIEFCTTLMYIGNLLTRYYSGLLTWFFEDHTAFMTEELDLWYNGGLADMGANV